MMDLSDLRIFTAVVREGGVTRASEKLHRVQSNVTTRIRQLEDKLGVRLFLREGKRLMLAPAGHVLLGYADRLLDLAEEAKTAVHGSAPSGTFRLGAMESTAAVRLPGPLAEFSRLYPDVTLELKTGNPVQLSAAILAGELDAALVAEPVAEFQLESVVAFEEEPVLVMADRLPGRDGDGPLPKTVIVFEHGCPHRRRLEEWYAARGEVPERTIELGSYHAMLGCVLAGMGAALLPRSVLETFPESRRLNVHPLPPGGTCLRTLLIWRRGAAGPNVRALEEILTSHRGD
jgi:DNA-binding transcriptional LysR family regulator